MIGVDLSTLTSVATWKCLMQPGGQGPIHMGVPRIYTSTNKIDHNGLQSASNAHEAGVEHVGGYIFPSVPSGDGKEQVQKAVDAYHQMMVDGGYQGETTIWLDVERRAWDTDLSKNQQFIKDMMSAELPSDFKFGIYSNYYNWQDIVGLGWSYPAEKGLPLWYAHYDNDPHFTDFKPFGGWSVPFMKQYEGDHTSCGQGIDYDYYPKDSVPESKFLQ